MASWKTPLKNPGQLFQKPSFKPHHKALMACRPQARQTSCRDTWGGHPGQRMTSYGRRADAGNEESDLDFFMSQKRGI